MPEECLLLIALRQSQLVTHKEGDMQFIDNNGQIISTTNDLTINQYKKKGFVEYKEPEEKKPIKKQPSKSDK